MKLFVYKYWSQLILFGIFVSVLPFRFYHINAPLFDAASFRQAQTATVVRNYYATGINLFRSELDILGIGKEKYLTLEFPFYEAVVTVLYKAFYVSETWGRIVSIASGLIAALFVYLIAKELIRREGIALLSTFFFLYAPLNMFYQRAFLIESTVIACLLMGFYFYLRWIQFESVKILLLGMFLLTLGFVQKGVYGPFWLLPLFVYYAIVRSKKDFFRLNLFLAVVIPLSCLFLWQRYVNYINVANGNDYFTTYHPGHLLWNFGTLNDRISLAMWSPRLMQLLNGILLKPGLIFFVVGLMEARKHKNHLTLYAWLGSALVYFVTLFRIQSHNYYQMIMVPPFVLFMAIGFTSIVNWLSSQIHRKLKSFSIKQITTGILLFGCVLFGVRAWMFARWSFVTENNEYQRILEIKQILPNGPGVFVLPGYDWNSVYSYYLGKKLLAADASELTQKQIDLWKKSGYTFLMLNRYPEYQDYLINKNIDRDISFIESIRGVIVKNDLLIVPL